MRQDMKNAIVTGATKGIGLAIARMLLSEGYSVTVTYAHDDQSAAECAGQLSQISDNYDIVKVNQADKTQMAAFIADFKEKKQHVDCLVCNAGATLRQDLASIEDDAWEHVMNVNLNSNVYMIRDLLDNFPPWCSADWCIKHPLM